MYSPYDILAEKLCSQNMNLLKQAPKLPENRFLLQTEADNNIKMQDTLNQDADE
jgi:hypothetical protein